MEHWAYAEKHDADISWKQQIGCMVGTEVRAEVMPG